MANQSEYLDLMKGRLGLVSDYALSQRWRIEPTRISQYRKNRLRLPIEFILDISRELSI
ncbi:Uncharacterised protein [Neisseria animalis]|nr:Uncharacterised protein [Neisseria animalis]